MRPEVAPLHSIREETPLDCKQLYFTPCKISVTRIVLLFMGFVYEPDSGPLRTRNLNPVGSLSGTLHTPLVLQPLLHGCDYPVYVVWRVDGLSV